MLTAKQKKYLRKKMAKKKRQMKTMTTEGKENESQKEVEEKVE